MVAQKDFLIISMFSRAETGYARYYIESLEAYGFTYDIAYFERYEMSRKPDANEILFSEYCPTGGNNFKKIPIMVRYMRFVRHLLKSRMYKKVIVLTTVPGVMAADILNSRYANKFLIDIRDYTHENNAVYRRVLKSLIDSSYGTIISSPGFRRFLPESEKYTVVHNIEKGYPRVNAPKLLQGRSFVIGFAGSIRYFDINSLLCDQAEASRNVSLKYFGTQDSGQNLEQYCKEKGYSSVEFYGPFIQKEKPAIYNQIDFINAIYDTRMQESLTAIPNRFYDAAIYKRPIIVSKDTFLEEMVVRYNLGFAIDINSDDISAMVRAYADLFDEGEFLRGCERLLADVEADMSQHRQLVEDFIDS